MATIRAAKHRLPPEAYLGCRRVFFTACIRDRKKLFVSQSVVEPFVRTLAHWTAVKRCIVPIYCFMPDHLHVMVAGVSAESRPKEVMDEFKQTTGNWLAKRMPSYHWQKDYHDHIIRISDDWRSHVRYVLANPVRAGLCEHSLGYPFLGSIGVNIEDVLGEL